MPWHRMASASFLSGAHNCPMRRTCSAHHAPHKRTMCVARGNSLRCALERASWSMGVVVPACSRRRCLGRPLGPRPFSGRLRTLLHRCINIYAHTHKHSNAGTHNAQNTNKTKTRRHTTHTHTHCSASNARTRRSQMRTSRRRSAQRHIAERTAHA